MAITGGSTSAFCEGHYGNPTWLQVALDEYKKNSFLVYNLGMPGYRIDSGQAILTRYADKIDTFIAHIGFNELMNLTANEPVESVSSFFSLMNFYGHSRHWSFLRYNLYSTLQFAYHNSAIKKSNLLSALYHLLTLILRTDTKRIKSEMRNDDFTKLHYPPLKKSVTEKDYVDSIKRYLVPMKASANYYDVNLLIVFQPLLHFKEKRIEEENKYFTSNEEILQARRYMTHFKQTLQKLKIKYIDNSDLFSETKTRVFRDAIHFYENEAKDKNGCYFGAKKMVDGLKRFFSL